MNYTSTEQRYASAEVFMHPGESFPEDACAECFTECQDGSCTQVAKTTSQCTDRCVVVACNDPTHGEMSCHGDQPCDIACNHADCHDCDGFEEFLQWCTDYHAYFSDVRPLTSQTADPIWDPSLDAMFCDCGEARSDNIMYSNSSAMGSGEAESCLWGDCELYSSPECIPGPSTGSQSDAALSILASHLFQDHLGLPNGITSTYVPVTQLHASFDTDGLPTPSDSASTPSSDSPGPTVHVCLGTHICNWQSCSLNFKSCDELTAHITSAHVGAGKAHYECFWDGCKRHGDQGFSSKQKICRHIQSHTGHRPFQCKVCKQNFSEAATLQQHMRRHTLEKPYLCDFPGCGKAFAITGALTIHKRTHNGQKPFKCTYCDRAFAESSNLSKHLRTHTGDRPYSCGEVGCGKAFARPDQLTRHMTVHRSKSDGRGK